MIFNSDVFLFGFLPIVFSLFWTLRGKQARYVLLAISGYVFYGWWNWRYCFLLLFSSLISFTAGLLLDRSPSPRRQKLIVTTTVAIDLTLLGFFKYFNFLSSSVRALFPGAPLPLLDVVLPIGISFYTFHTISYVIDVSHDRVRATHNVWEYLTYVNLFSQLVAGPIVRFRQIEGDLANIDGPPKEAWVARGVAMFLFGLAKKVLIADRIARHIDPILSSWTGMSFSQAWIAALGYTAQLYFDFSGYSDMAVGLGLLFGLRIPQNFNSPYRALGIMDFWRRWHISLSTWLRDYLYFPLGGNRKGAARTYRNLMIVMVLGGLWHGSSWTFVVWGAYHGLLLIVDRVGQPVYQKLPKWIYLGQTFLLVVVGWVFFRSTSFPMAFHWLKTMVTPTANFNASLPALLWTGIGLAGVAFLPEGYDVRFPVRVRWAIAYALVFVFLYMSMNGSETVFLYYQF
ncbi:MAG: MBOAT family protein [Acidobacteriota bacterium]|nr:MBOAT family protein [Acidobacteriota bacterium]